MNNEDYDENQISDDEIKRIHGFGEEAIPTKWKIYYSSLREMSISTAVTRLQTNGHAIYE